MQRSIPALTIAAALLVGSLARAATIDIQFTGMNLEYDASNGIIFDAGGVAGGGGDPALADQLTSVTFHVDGSLVGTLTSDIWLDVLITGVTGLPVGGGAITTSGQGDTFGFDLILENNVPGWGLALNLDEVFVAYSGNEISISGSALVSSVGAPPNLPFLVDLDTAEQITIAFSSSNLTNVTGDGTHLTGFHAAGTGSVSGTGQLIPEPASAVLFMLGMIALGGRARRRG